MTSFRDSLMAALSPADVALLEVTFARNRARFGELRMEADGDGGDQGGDGPGDDAGKGDEADEGGKRVADMTLEEKVTWQQQKMRQMEDQLRSKSPDPDKRALRKQLEEAKGKLKEYEPKIRDHDALLESIKTEQERRDEQVAKEAAEKARAQADSEALSKFGPRLVGAEFRAQLAGKMPAEAITKLVGGLNVGQFLTDEGEPDSEAVAEFVTPIVAALPKQGSTVPPDLGAGKRQPPAADAQARAEAAYLARHGKKSSA